MTFPRLLSGVHRNPKYLWCSRWALPIIHPALQFANFALKPNAFSLNPWNWRKILKLQRLESHSGASIDHGPLMCGILATFTEADARLELQAIHLCKRLKSESKHEYTQEQNTELLISKVGIRLQHNSDPFYLGIVRIFCTGKLDKRPLFDRFYFSGSKFCCSNKPIFTELLHTYPHLLTSQCYMAKGKVFSHQESDDDLCQTSESRLLEKVLQQMETSARKNL